MADISSVTLPGGSTYNLKDPVARASIPYGEVDSTSTATAYTATVSGITEYYDGVCVMLKNGVVTSAAGFTININGLGAKPVYSNMATGNDVTPTAPTRDTTIFNIDYTMLLIYSSEIVSGGGWICYRGYDANTNTIGYQLRTNSSTRPASDTGYRYRLWFTSADNTKWVPANTSTSTNATAARTMNTRPIDPFGPIGYYSTNGTVSSGSSPSATTMWEQYTLTIGYSYMASGFALVANAPVYLKCTPQADGSAVMQSIVSALPSSADGYIYIYLGQAYSKTAMELCYEHPVYWHDGTGIRLWAGVQPYVKPSGGIPASDLASGVIPSVDSEPVSGSTNPVSSGGVYDLVHWTSGENYDYVDVGSANSLLRFYGDGARPTYSGADMALRSDVPSQASIGSTGLISFKNSSGTQLFTLQLPLYNGGVT